MRHKALVEVHTSYLLEGAEIMETLVLATNKEWLRRGSGASTKSRMQNGEKNGELEQKKVENISLWLGGDLGLARKIKICQV